MHSVVFWNNFHVVLNIQSSFDLLRLLQALINEKAAPEILQYETELMGRLDTTMQHQVSSFEDNAW